MLAKGHVAGAALADAFSSVTGRLVNCEVGNCDSTSVQVWGGIRYFTLADAFSSVTDNSQSTSYITLQGPFGSISGRWWKEIKLNWATQRPYVLKMATHGSLTTRPVLSTRIHSWDHAYQGYSDKDVIANLVLEGETQKIYLCCNHRSCRLPFLLLYWVPWFCLELWFK